MGPTGAKLAPNPIPRITFQTPTLASFFSAYRKPMTVLRPRSRSISVRLSEEEFLSLRRLCVSSGARSVSDLARKAMQDILERAEAENQPAFEKGAHKGQIGHLERKIAELAAELALFKAQQVDPVEG